MFAKSVSAEVFVSIIELELLVSTVWGDQPVFIVKEQPNAFLVEVLVFVNILNKRINVFYVILKKPVITVDMFL